MAPLPLVYLGPHRAALAVLIPMLFITFFAHVTNIVAYTVTGTSGLPNEQQGLATGLTSMTQQVAFAIGIPLMGAIAATQSVELAGIHLAIVVNSAVLLASVIFVWIGMRPRVTGRSAALPASQEHRGELAVSSDSASSTPAFAAHRNAVGIPPAAFGCAGNPQSCLGNRPKFSSVGPRIGRCGCAGGRGP